MNKIVTSQEAILKVSQKIASKQGLQSINIRTIAKECHVSVGSIYNYFPSKADLVIATIEEIWKSFFHMRNDYNNFINCVEDIFEIIQLGTKEYPGFFMAHAHGLDKESLYRGRIVMEKYFLHIQKGMILVLHQDVQIQKHIFNQEFTESDFIQFVFSNMMTLLSQNQTSCHTLIEVIQRILY